MDPEQYTPEDGPFVTVLDTKFGTLYYKISADNPRDSPSTPQVVELAVAIMEQRLTNFPLRPNGFNVDPDTELKVRFGNVIEQVGDKIPREKLFVTVKVQDPKKKISSFLPDTLSLMKLKSVDL
ncbi:hypothetical protein Landi51_00477 [Colletotrichum acutatum]